MKSRCTSDTQWLTTFQYFAREKDFFIELYMHCAGAIVKAEDIQYLDLNAYTEQKERHDAVAYLTTDNCVILVVEYNRQPVCGADAVNPFYQFTKRVLREMQSNNSFAKYGFRQLDVDSLAIEPYVVVTRKPANDR